MKNDDLEEKVLKLEKRIELLETILLKKTKKILNPNRCKFVTEKDGFRWFFPQCMGGAVYGIHGCTCDRYILREVANV